MLGQIYEHVQTWVAADLKTRQGLKPTLRVGCDCRGSVAADLKTRQGLKHTIP